MLKVLCFTVLIVFFFIEMSIFLCFFLVVLLNFGPLIILSRSHATQYCVHYYFSYQYRQKTAGVHTIFKFNRFVLL